MATPTFTYPVLVNASAGKTMRVRKAQFGDGYSQAVADGINNIIQSWNVSFVGKSTAVTPIVTFLEGQGGYQSFYWTPKLGVQGLYRCETYQLSAMGNDFFTITATFVQAFAP